MGTVFLVEHLELHSRHALKVLAWQLSANTAHQERFLQEGRVMASLRHPNIAQVTDVVTEGVAGLVMEYVEGPTLSEWMDEHGAQDLASCRRLLHPVLKAVKAAHSHANRIVHRDIKPDNILLGTDSEGDMRPVILDFGIAKLLGGRGRQLCPPPPTT